MINEALLSFIWRYKYYSHDDITTTDGKKIKIVKVGSLNHDQGPDYLHAQIYIDDIEWVGNVEIDLKRSYWKTHKHDSSPFYKNVILHVVWQEDTQNIQTSFPVLELQAFVPKYFLEQFSQLMNAQTSLLCSAFCNKVNPLVWTAWKERMFVERMEYKTYIQKQYLEDTQGHWEQVFFISLMRNFGLSANAYAFEAIAKTIPIELFAKVKSSLLQIEAILFGQAQLLNEDFKDEYPNTLKKEYQFLKHKYTLNPPEVKLQFAKMRPYAFPTIRLAQMANLIFISHGLFSKIVHIVNIEDYYTLFDVKVNTYWKNHFRFDVASSVKSEKKIGKTFFQSLVINTILPVLFLYAKMKNLKDIQEKVIAFYQSLPYENNKIMRIWKEAEIQNTNAFDSQSLYHLYQQYCTKKNCLQCSIAHSLLKKA